jgi:hypothetical protein
MGFFVKLSKVDCWVVLDHVHNNPRDASFWCRRVKIISNQSDQWLSLPLNKPVDCGVIGIPILEMTYNMSNPEVYGKAVRTIEQFYKKTPFFDDFFPLIHTFLLSKEDNLCRRNMSFIKEILATLEITPSIIYSSELNCVKRGNDLLIEILKKVGATKYVCGDGASGYQDELSFKQNIINLEYNNFRSKPYPQKSSPNFIPGLSIIDALMNVGAEGTKQLIVNRNES